MPGAVRRIVTRWLRIPPDPQPPAGSRASVRVFRASPLYLRYKLMGWGLRQAGVVVGLLLALAFGQFGLALIGLDDLEVTRTAAKLPRPIVALAERLGFVERTRSEEDGAEHVRLALDSLLVAGELLGFGAFVVQLPLTYLGVVLAWELRWYIVTDRSLRIREGVFSVREITMTFANVQNLAIVQGPVQRLFGIADLRVRSAGGGSEGENDSSGEQGGDKDSMHVGYFRGVDNAEELRDTILRRLRALGDAGLGETGKPPVGAPAAASVAAARRVLEEARALRAALGGGSCSGAGPP